MSTQALRTATTAAAQPKTFPELLEKMRPEIARALPKHMNADRMMRIALTEFRKAPKLGECELSTVFGAIITLSQLGLEPGVLGQAYLIPYKKVCQGIPGWQGYADLVARGGRASIWTGAVYKGDAFDYELGDRPFIKHKPDESGALQGLDELRYVYSVGRIKGAEWPVIEVWSTAKIEAHRNRFNKVGSAHYSYQHFEMYGRKIPLLQVIKYMPKSVEIQQAFDLDQAAENGQTIDMKAALDGSWIPTGEPDSTNANGADAPATAATGSADGQGVAGYKALYDDASAIAKIHEATTPEQLEGIWAAITADYSMSKRQISNEVHGAYTGRKEALAQKSQK